MASEEESDIEVDEEQIIDSVVPFYLLDSPTYRAYIRQQRRREKEETYDKLSGKPSTVLPSVPVPKWRVQTRELMAWRENRNDEKSIYNLHDDRVVTECSLTKSIKFDKEAEGNISQDTTDLRREREYIFSATKDFRAPVRSTRKHILLHAMKEYHKPATPPSVGSYGSPRSRMDLYQRAPKQVDVHTVRINRVSSGALKMTQSRGGSPCRQYRQGSNSTFCDVLGPVCCQKCIELVNRKMASEVQSTPNSVELMTSKLVSPNLIKLMNTPCRFTTMDNRTIVETRRSASSLSGALALRETVKDKDASKLPKLPLGSHNRPARSSSPMKSMDGFLAGKAFQSAKRGKEYGRRGAVAYSAR